MTLATMPSAEHLLAELKTRLGDHVVSGWEGRGGADLYDATARVFAHAGMRTRCAFLGATHRRAAGPSRYRTTVRLTWHAAPAAPYRLAAGQLLFATAWGVRFRLLEEVTRTPDDPPGTRDVPVEAEWAGLDAVVAPGTIRHILLDRPLFT